MGSNSSAREARAALEARERPRRSKVVDADTALDLVKDGDHVAIGGTLYSRTPMALVFALLRKQRRHLKVSRPLSCYEADLLLASGSADTLMTSWVGIGLKWGLSPIVRTFVEEGLAQYEEWSHLGLGLRYKAAAMGIPFLPTFTMLGSDLAEARDLQSIRNPYGDETLLAIPALFPDVALIHVHRCDEYGNAQIAGYRHMDADMVRAARTVIISTEQLLPEQEIRAAVGTTVVPHFAVDAVVEAPFGAYPNECYGLYEADLDHFDDYVTALRDGGVDAAREYVRRNVFGVPDFAAFLDSVGVDRLNRQAERATELMPS